LGPVGTGVAGGGQLPVGQGVRIAGGEHIEVLAGGHPPGAIADVAIEHHRREAVTLSQQIVLQPEEGKGAKSP
jgi:hypothetical protein